MAKAQITMTGMRKDIPTQQQSIDLTTKPQLLLFQQIRTVHQKKSKTLMTTQVYAQQGSPH